MPDFWFQQRKATAAVWASKNPVVLDGQIAYETDTGKFKFGDGETPYNSLPYYVPGDFEESLQEHVDDPTPHPAYDDGPTLTLLYENAKV